MASKVSKAGKFGVFGSKKVKSRVKAGKGKSNFKTILTFVVANKWLIMAAVLLSFSAAAYQIGWAERVYVSANSYLDQKAERAGLVYKEAQMSGLFKTREKDITGAMNLELGTPMFRVDINELRSQIEFLPWVKTAFVSRNLPNSLQVEVVEREPYALWQYEGEIWLIDEEGVQITQLNLGQYNGLPFVVGKGAPKEVEGLMTVLKTEQLLAGRVKTAIRVGERRWDVEFDTGARLRLPAEGEVYNLEMAWQRFADLERSHNLLGRDVATYDMRLSDRMTVQLTDDGKETLRAKGAPT